MNSEQEPTSKGQLPVWLQIVIMVWLAVVLFSFIWIRILSSSMGQSLLRRLGVN